MNALRVTRPPLILLLIALAACSRHASACDLLNRRANSAQDSGAALIACIRQTAPGQTLALAPGVYVLKRPVIVDRSIRLTTAGLANDPRGCAALPGRCATLLLDPQTVRPRTMPLEVAADRVTFSHLVIRGSGETAPRRDQCQFPEMRPLGGGIRVSGSDFVLRKSLLRDFACYSALEIVRGATRPTLEGNVIGPNGDHRPGGDWSDGTTIHDTRGATVSGNLFIDNTDVQLIFGGCRDCRIEDNRFRHSGSFDSASFAELMLQSWPSTSGDYRGTVVRRNSIDCGPARRCGYGIMLGSAPWYKGRARGGAIVGNTITNAMIAINVDSLSGPMTVMDNRVERSGGRFQSDCGVHDWPQVNISPASRRYLRGNLAASASISTVGCLLNRRGS